MTAAQTTVMRRAFFALWPDAATASAIASASGADPDAVAVADLHLTLVFVGAVNELHFAQLPLLATGLGVLPFDVCLDHAEYWARPRVRVALPRVVPVALRNLRLQLCARLSAAGIGERRSTEPEFRPHVSLTRGSAPGECVNGAIAPVLWHVAALSLAVTEPVPRGARYRRVATLPLSPAAV